MSWGWIFGGAVAVGAALLASEDETPTRRLQPGDIIKSWRQIDGSSIGFTQGIYDHYAVYVSHNEVIHFTSKDSDSSGDMRIQATDFEWFLRGDPRYYIVVFPEKDELLYGRKTREVYRGYHNSIISPTYPQYGELLVPEWVKERYQKYPPEEVIERARSALNDSKPYDLISNNCEHFAVWCATGLHESEQVNRLLRLIDPLKLAIIT